MRTTTKNVVIFTDIRGVDAEDYIPAVAEARSAGVPIVLVSSATRVELEYVRRVVRVGEPYSPEYAGAIYVPRGYFPFEVGVRGPASLPVDPASVELDESDMMPLGISADDLAAELRRIGDRHGCRFVTTDELTAEAFAAETGLPLGMALLAQQREWSVPFRLGERGHPAVLDAVVAEIRAAGLRVSFDERFHVLHGPVDQRDAVWELRALLQRHFGAVRTVGIGDSPRHIGVLTATDEPFLVQGPNGTHDNRVLAAVPGARAVRGSGPVGWANAVRAALADR